MPTFSGDALLDYLNAPAESFPYIAEGLLYGRACIMFVAEPGIGKSVLATQAAMELAAGVALFNTFKVTRPYRVLYVQKERPLDEIRERIQAMHGAIKFDPNNLTITDDLQRYNLTNVDHAKQAVGFIAHHKPEVVIIDPIYAGQADLRSGDAGVAFTNFLTLLEYETKACLWLNHHTIKAQMDRDGVPIKRQDPFYGSQWLKAHVSGSFLITSTKDGTLFVCKKDSHSRLIKSFTLEFDPETYLSGVTVKGVDALDRIKNACVEYYRQKQSFTVYDVMGRANVSRKTFYKTMVTPELGSHLKAVSTESRGRKHYEWVP